MNALQISLIHALTAAAEAHAMPVWLEGGWAVDARLGRVTRPHEDIDLAFPGEREGQFKELLGEFGAGGCEETDYGFLVRIGGILLDCEPCTRIDGDYELAGCPPGSCPDEKQGVIDGVAVRCTSWEALLWDYFHYLREVAYSQWPAKDKAAYEFVRDTVGRAQVERWHRRFLSTER